MLSRPQSSDTKKKEKGPRQRRYERVICENGIHKDYNKLWDCPDYWMVNLAAESGIDNVGWFAMKSDKTGAKGHCLLLLSKALTSSCNDEKDFDTDLKIPMILPRHVRWILAGESLTLEGLNKDFIPIKGVTESFIFPSEFDFSIYYVHFFKKDVPKLRVMFKASIAKRVSDDDPTLGQSFNVPWRDIERSKAKSYRRDMSLKRKRSSTNSQGMNSPIAQIETPFQIQLGHSGRPILDERGVLYCLIGKVNSVEPSEGQFSTHDIAVCFRVDWLLSFMNRSFFCNAREKFKDPLPEAPDYPVEWDYIRFCMDLMEEALDDLETIDYVPCSITWLREGAKTVFFFALENAQFCFDIWEIFRGEKPFTKEFFWDSVVMRLPDEWKKLLTENKMVFTGVFYILGILCKKLWKSYQETKKKNALDNFLVSLEDILDVNDNKKKECTMNMLKPLLHEYEQEGEYEKLQCIREWIKSQFGDLGNFETSDGLESVQITPENNSSNTATFESDNGSTSGNTPTLESDSRSTTSNTPTLENDSRSVKDGMVIPVESGCCES